MPKTEQSFLNFFAEENRLGVAYKNWSRKRNIINYLDQYGETTIADIAQALNISTPKVTSLIGELMEIGLLKDYGKIDSTGGRPANLFGLKADACYYIGVDVKSYYVNIGLLDFGKNLIHANMHVPYVLENSQKSLDALIALINTFIKKAPVPPSKILAACINLSGRINSQTGYSFSYFHFNEIPLVKSIENKIGIKTFLENDSRAMAYGEFHKGIVNNEKNVIFINLDYGIGLGILIDGKVYYGKSGFSGEIGHIPLFDNEIICQCGKKGCLETEASGKALIRIFKEKITSGNSSSIINDEKNLENLRLTNIIEAAQNEDMLTIDLLSEIGEKLGRAIALLINIFNPEMVILGGPISNTGDYIHLPIKSAIHKYSLNIVNNDTKLCISKLGEKSGLIGGCLIARNRLLIAD